jgi:Domain of unknown function (DUF4136)
MERNKFGLNIITPMLLFLMALAGCSGVKSEMDKSANLQTFKTFAWKAPDVKTENPLYKGDLIDNTIKQSIESELANRGMSRDDVNPDIYVLYHSYTQTSQGTGYSPLYSGYAPIYYTPMGYGVGYGWGYGFSSATYPYGYTFGGYPAPYFYTQETLTIDFIDAKSNKVVWRGSIDSDVTDTTHIDKTLSKDVHAIMKKYSENSDGKMIKHHI